MKCESPFYSKKFQCFFPCRNCLPCRIRRSRDWSSRIILEMSQHSQNAFLTLTYDDDHIPVNFSLRSKDLQNVFKRVRRAGLKFRYFACGEYGTQSFRPHYHVILFGVNYLVAREFFEECWSEPSDHSIKLGRVQCVFATIETACYTAGYVTKKLSKRQDLVDSGMENEFIRSSKKPSIGLSALEQFIRAHRYNNDIDVFKTIRVGDKLRIMPKFLRDKLRAVVFDEDYIQKLKEARILDMQDQIDALVEKHFSIQNGKNFKSYSLEANRKEHMQEFLNIHSRQKIFNQRSKI